MKKDVLTKELKEIEEKEDKLLHRKNKHAVNTSKNTVKHFSFKDFSQAMVGAGVFGLPSLINTSFWDYLPFITTMNMLLIHVFFLSCVYITLNYDYRNTFTYDAKFLEILSLRFFYLYMSVGIVMFIMLIMLGKLQPDFNVLDSIRNFMAAQSVGMVGAIAFTFIAKGGD